MFGSILYSKIKLLLNSLHIHKHLGMKDEVLQTCALLTYFRILYLRIP